LREGQQGDGLAKARMQWFFGEWSALQNIDPKTLREHAERDRLALLVASAHAQLGSYEEARQHVYLALKWGCPPRLVAQVLIAGVHNSLGRAAAIAGDDRRTARHFREAVAVTNNQRETDLLSHARSVREMAKLGLLPEAVSLVDQELAKTKSDSQRPEMTRARIGMLETEMELLRQELSLAQQRRQLYTQSGGREGKTARSEGSNERLEALKHKSVSQLGQDLWVLEQTGYKRGGFFVEFGATDGVLLSNTYLLEKEFGWKGICAEPNPRFYTHLKANRTCTVTDECIAGTTGREVEFILADDFGGLAEYASSDMHADKRAAFRKAGKTIRLRTICLDDLLENHGAPREIDYLSIDTEGSEFEILSTFPFGKWRIELITVEHNFTAQRKNIRDLLSRHGYRCLERDWDDWYVLEDEQPV
jgi:FkbM family methyltransferase